MTASGCNWLGVASVDEGCQLRSANIDTPILLLGPCPSWALNTALSQNITLTLTDASQIAGIAKSAKQINKNAYIHLKIDTGMHRLGISPNEAIDVLNKISEHKEIKLQGIYSHLAKAGEREFTYKQKEVFDSVLKQIKQVLPNLQIELTHLASSEATKFFPETHYDMVRVGLYLYGLEANSTSSLLHPALSVRGRINHIQEIEAHEAVGYGLTWEPNRKSRIASIPIGYADGIDRKLSNNMTALLHGHEIKQVGLISMDQMLFDITDVPQTEESDVITLIGSETTKSNSKKLHLATWAKALNTITYELACRLKVRMPRIYTRQPFDKDK